MRALPSPLPHPRVPGPRPPAGVTLVELLVALAIVTVLTSFLFTSFATATRSVEIGEARQDVLQNARVALGHMAREIQTAVLDSRNRDFVFVCADGLNGLPHARIEFAPGAAPPIVPAAANNLGYGVGNAQHPLGLDFTANGTTYLDYGQVYDLYRAPFGTLTRRVVSIKANDTSLPPGPPDRLDFVGLAANIGAFTTNQNAQFSEIRYTIATDAFNDGEDNDFDTTVDAADSTLPSGAATWTGAGDMLILNNLRTQDLANVVRLALYRAIDTTPDSNPFSNRERPRATNVLTDVNDPGGRYPYRDFDELTLAEGGSVLGAFIYDVQFEFYGRIAVDLDATGAPERFGVGWGYQDARGEDIGIDGDPSVFDACQADGLMLPNEDVNGNGTLDAGEDLGFDGLVNDPLDDGSGVPNCFSDNDGNTAEPSIGEGDGILGWEDMGLDGRRFDAGDINPLTSLPDGRPVFGMPDNISDNDGVAATAPCPGANCEASIGEGNGRLDSRVMGVWDSRSPDPRNPRRAAELNGQDDDGDAATFTTDTTRVGATPIDNDGDGAANAADDATADAQGRTEGDLNNDGLFDINDDFRQLFDSVDDDADNWRDDRYYEGAGRPEGADEPDEATTADDNLPQAVRITITIRDRNQVLEPFVMSTTVWLSS